MTDAVPGETRATGDEPDEPVEQPDQPDQPDETDEPDETAQSEQVGEDETEKVEVEGPRRRARRERAERRAAQARAQAIEDARRAAKREVLDAAAGTDARPRRGLVRGLKALTWAVVLIVLGVAVSALLYFTPVMSVRGLVVEGIAEVPYDEVVAAVAVQPGTPLLQVDTDAVADRVATIRRVASVRVQRQYPSSLRVTVAERIPVAVKDFPDGPHLFDRDGVDFATAPAPPGLPFLDVENPGPSDPPTRAALEVVTALRPEVAGQIGRVSAPSVASITLTLVDGRTVVWGTTDRTEEKAETLAALLTQPGSTYDVSSPDLPTVK